MHNILHHSFEGIVWRIYIDHATKHIIIETRNAATRSASYYGTSLLEPEMYSMRVPFGIDTWWIGIESVNEGVILFHKYDAAQWAQHTGIYAYNYLTNKELWKMTDVAFVSLHATKIITFNIKDPSKMLCLHLHTGDVQAQVSFTGSYTQTALTPQIFYPDDEKYGIISNYIFKKTQYLPSHEIQYLEYNSKIFITYTYKKHDKLYENILLLSNEGEILLHKTIHTAMWGSGNGSFFIFEQKLIVICEKHIIEIYNL
ncbi:MAG: DUF4905 domain-containing protein [Cytophagales bacterium]|nr:DUF4905 domain-containing protein [Cytophagales bacterium]